MVEAELLDYTVNSVTEGIEALATTRVIIKPSGKLAAKAVTEHATKGRISRSFSGARAGRAGGRVVPRADPRLVVGSVAGGRGAPLSLRRQRGA